jgi:hypothetical protein
MHETINRNLPSGTVLSNQNIGISGSPLTPLPSTICTTLKYSYFQTNTSLPVTIHSLSIMLETAKLHPRDMTDIAAPKYSLFLPEWTHGPSIPVTNRRPSSYIEDLRLDGLHEPSNNRRMEWLVKYELLDALRSSGEYGLPIPHTQLVQEVWPARRTLGHSNGC